jgi:hypothetical protein
MLLVKAILRYSGRAFAAPRRRFSLYALGWYLAPYWILALVISLVGYGIIGQGHAAAILAGVAWILALVVGGIRVLPHADWPRGFGGDKGNDKRLK